MPCKSYQHNTGYQSSPGIKYTALMLNYASFSGYHRKNPSHKFAVIIPLHNTRYIRLQIEEKRIWIS